MERLPPLAAVALAAACWSCGSASRAEVDAAGNGPGDGRPGDGRPDAGLPVCTPVAGTPPLGLEEVGTGFDMPVFVTSPPGDPRLFVVEKTGRVRILDGGLLLPDPFLTVGSAPVAGRLQDERGLLGLAFHPGYADNGKLYVFYILPDGRTAIDQFRVSASDPNRADPASGERVLELEHVANNHNGGMIGFGPDGYLYIGVGDGGGAGDPGNRAQNLGVLFGKLLRIDVDTLPYRIPADNPFVGQAGRDEIWAYGLRNPWRWSFDRMTGDLFIGDVGQNRREEIDVQPAASSGGENYGWRVMEGSLCFNPSTCTPLGVPPVYEYSAAGTCNTVIGGYVYRGCRMPGHHGAYFFAEYCHGWVRSLRWDGAGGYTDLTTWDDLYGRNVVSFGEDAQGELYVVRQDTGQILQIVPR
jgi:glucose/arabinose dehydrogenase